MFLSFSLNLTCDKSYCAALPISQYVLAGYWESACLELILMATLSKTYQKYESDIFQLTIQSKA
jgi:hypothetical protein